MRIAIIADPLDSQTAGIHVYTKELIRAIIRLNTKHELIIVRSKEGTEDFGKAEQIIVPIRSFPPMHLRLRQIFTIPKILQEKKVNIVIEPAHFGPFNLPSSIKRVTVIHDLTPILFPQFHDKLSHYLHRLLLPSILRKADLIITNSAHTKKDVIDYFPFTKGKIKAILLGKDASFFPNKDEKVLKKYNIQQSYFLYVGTIEPRKNVNLILEGYELFRHDNPDSNTQLVLAGKKGWQMDAFYEKIEESPFNKDIIVTGYFEKEDVSRLYSMCTCFIYPSHYEGFGLPIVEAMACGAPVITARNSSLPEVGGDAALYLEENAPIELAQLLFTISKDKDFRREKIEESIKQAAKFSWEKMGKEVLSCLENMII